MVEIKELIFISPRLKMKSYFNTSKSLRMYFHVGEKTLFLLLWNILPLEIYVSIKSETHCFLSNCTKLQINLSNR